MSARRRKFLASLAVAICITIAWATWPRPSSPVALAIPVPLDPRQSVAMAVDGTTRRTFIAGAGLVYVLDLDKNALVRTVHTGNSSANPLTSPTPAILAVDRRAGHVFVANYVDGTVDMLDARSGQLLSVAPVSGAPEAMAVDERAGRIFVGGSQSSQLDVLDARTGTELSVGVDMTAVGPVVVDPHLQHGFAVDQDGAFDMFDTRTNDLLHSEAGHPYESLAVDTQMGRVLAVGDGTRNVSVYDARTGLFVGAVLVGVAPRVIVVDGRASRAFESDEDGTITTIDTKSLAILFTAAVGPHPWAVVDERRDRVVVASDTTVSVLDARNGRILGQQPLRLSPQAITLDERMGRVLIISEPGAQRLPESWEWIQRPLRRLLPFIPAPRHRTQTFPPRIVVLDEARLAA